MTLNYTENRIKEALRLSSGSTAKAKKQIFAWLHEDHKLLLDITRPHLNGIVAYALSRALSRMSKTDEELLEEEAMEAKASAGRNQSIGKDMLRGFASENAVQFGQETDSGRPLKRKAASQNHVDVIHMMAAKARDKSAK